MSQTAVAAAFKKVVKMEVEVAAVAVKKVVKIVMAGGIVEVSNAAWATSVQE